MIYPKIIIKHSLKGLEIWTGFRPDDKEKAKEFSKEDKQQVGRLYKKMEGRLYVFISNNVAPRHLFLTGGRWKVNNIWRVADAPWVVAPLIERLKRKKLPVHFRDDTTRNRIKYYETITKSYITASKTMKPEGPGAIYPDDLYQCKDLVNDGKDMLPHQLAFIERMEHETHLGLFDDMGSGKTLAVIYWIFKKSLFPALIIAPKLLTINFMMELEKWVNPGDRKFQRVKSGKDELVGDICVIGYSVLSTSPDMVQKIKKVPWKACVVDEAQAIKNDSKRGKATLSICRRIPRVVITTGTPVDNVPADLYNLLEILNANKNLGIRDRRDYDIWFCNGRQLSWGWDNRGISNADLLKAYLPFISMRRMKADLFPDLPEKSISVSLVPLSNQEEYDFAYDDFKRWIIETVTTQLIKDGENPIYANAHAIQRAIRSLHQVHLTQLMALRQLSAIGKLEYLEKRIQALCDQDLSFKADIKVVIFLYHKEIQQRLMKTWKNALHIFGEDNDEVRTHALKQFANGEEQIMLSSIKTCNYGVTFISAHHMKILEIPWTPSELIQCIDRIHRIGQTERCYIEILLGENTVDESIYKKLLKKEKMVDDILTISEKDITTEVIKDIFDRR
jgi:SWI/SNF-related matrix-associated actin-dependent regulator 1 of chromatin subfamily A